MASIASEESATHAPATGPAQPADSAMSLSRDEWLDVRHSAKAIQRELKSYKIRVDEFRDRIGTRRKAN